MAQRGPLTRAAVADRGKAQPTELTEAVRTQLRAASGAVRTIERQMLAPLTSRAQEQLLADLSACAAALTGGPAHRAAAAPPG